MNEITPNLPPRHRNQQGSLSTVDPLEDALPRTPSHPRQEERLDPDGARELSAFRERLVGKLGTSTRNAYLWGARELLLFVERRGLSIDRLTPLDWSGFQEEVRARGARGEMGRSWVPGALSGARRFLRERAENGGVLQASLVPYVTPRDLEAR